MTLTSDAVANILPALIGAQAAFGKAVRSARNDHFGSAYTPLDAVLEAIVPALNAHDLVLTQHTVMSDSGVLMLTTRITHTTGEWIGSEYPVLPTKPDPQGYGSALTYARRYAVLALTGVAPADDDDDGNRASIGTPSAESAAYRGRFPQRAERVDRGSDRGTHRTHVPVHEVDEMTARWSDEIDAAQSVADLDVIGATVKILPEHIRRDLRSRFKQRRAALLAVECDGADLRAVDRSAL